jgi:hypothetical protein
MRTFLRFVAPLALLLPVAGAAAQQWTFTGYLADKAFPGGMLLLKEDAPGRYKARVSHWLPNEQVCGRVDVPASLELQGDEQVVTLAPSRVAGRAEVRFLLKADGSGGRKEERQADGSWRWDGYDRGLKRK